jgi:hypothetical protein
MPGTTPPDPGKTLLLAVLRAALSHAEALADGGNAAARTAATHLRAALGCLEPTDGTDEAARDEG